MLAASMTANFLAQCFLWGALGWDVANHHFTPGMWGVFGIGAVFVVVALWLQLQARAKARRARVGQPHALPTWQERWLPRLLLGNLLAGAAGNGIDLVLMWVNRVPLDSRDVWLAAIALASAATILLLAPVWRLATKPFAPLRRWAEAETRGPWYTFLFTDKYPAIRLKLAIGLSTRVVVQAVLGFLALYRRIAPMDTPTLVALTIVMATFTPGFALQKIAFQKRGYPTEEATANFGLYAANAIIGVGPLWIASLLAAH